MSTPTLVNRIFAALFLLFQVPGSEGPADNYKGVEEVLQRQRDDPPKTRVEHQRAIDDLVKAVSAMPSPDPGPSIESICRLAHDQGLQVQQEKDSSTISKTIHSFKLSLTIGSNGPEGRWSVRVSVVDSGVRHGWVYLDVIYWQPPDCPVLVSQPYLHPKANSFPIVRNIALGLIATDIKFGNDSIFTQVTSWLFRD